MKIKDWILVLIASFMFGVGTKYLFHYLHIKSNAWFYLLVPVVMLILYKLISKEKWKDYGIKNLNSKNIKLGFYFLFALFPIALIGRLLDPSFDVWYAQQNNLLVFSGLISMSMFMVLYVIKEELFERSLIQSKLSRSYGSFLTAIIVSINFALLHFYFPRVGLNHVVATVISVFFGSLVIVLLYEITKSLFTTIITHLVYNVIIIWQMFLHANNMILAEVLFWVVFGILFALTYKKVVGEIKKIKIKVKLGYLDWVFILIFVLVLPLVMIFL